jgi:hypothetical protein
MKCALKRLSKALWRTTAPIRRPILVRAGAYLEQRLLAPDDTMSHEINGLLDHLARELSRTQRRVESLQLAVEELKERREVVQE